MTPAHASRGASLSRLAERLRITAGGATRVAVRQTCGLLVIAPLFSACSSVSAADLANLCKVVECAGPFATLEVFKNAAGADRLIRVRGDFTKCSHPPAIYLTPDGGEIARLDDWMRGSEQTEQADKQHRELTAGLHASESVSCQSLDQAAR